MLSEIILNKISAGKKILALLIDPEEFKKVNYSSEVLNKADFILIGGSTNESNNMDEVCLSIREMTQVPLILFPGSYSQLTAHADACLFLSLLSGRNAEFLIGQQVQGAPLIQALNLEPLSCAYMLIGESNDTAVSRVTGTDGMSLSEPDKIVNTALAGSYMGMRHCYLEAGSGSSSKVPADLISQVKKRVNSVLWVGGGMRSKEDVNLAWEAGADVVVIGTWIEEDPLAIFEIKH